MGYEGLELEDLEADFAAQGEAEFDEADEADSALEMEALVERVKAARCCGA